VAGVALATCGGIANWGSLRRGIYTAGIGLAGDGQHHLVSQFPVGADHRITLFVLALLVIVVIKFNAKSTRYPPGPPQHPDQVPGR